MTETEIPDSWIALCPIGDLAPNSSMGFDLYDGIFLVKKRDQVFAYRNHCPHLGLPLNWLPDKFLDLDAELIQCSAHGARFRINDGQCVAGPCIGRSLQAIPCREIKGKICIPRAPDNST